MLQSISWNQYFLTLLFLGLIYYTVIGFRFYKWEILKLLGIERTDTKVFQGATVHDLINTGSKESDVNYMPKASPKTNISTGISAFADEVKAYTKEANTKMISRDEMIEAIKIIASKYPELRRDDITQGLEEYITSEINTKYPNESFNDSMFKLWN